MNVFSMHSHKGGVGKTTFSLFLSKYLARVNGEKTCLVDLDFQAPGLRGVYFRENMEYDFSDYLLAEDKKRKEIAAKLPTAHRQINKLFFIAGMFKPHASAPVKMETARKMYIKLANEIYTGEITDGITDLLQDLKKEGFKNVIIDCHPGLILLSEKIIKERSITPVFFTTPNIISLVGLFGSLIDHHDDWGLKLSQLKIIFNRVPPDFTPARLERQLDELQDSADTSHDEKLVCAAIKKQFTGRTNQLMFIAENEDIRDMDSLVTPRTLLSLDVPVDLRRVIKQVI